MKKSIAWFLILVLLLTGLTACGEPEEGPKDPTGQSQPGSSNNDPTPGKDDPAPTTPPAGSSQGLDLQLNEDATAYVVCGIGSCSDKELVIPAEHEGLPVTHIRQRAFYDVPITAVTIPGSIVQIGSNAFARTDLTTVTIPGTVKVVESSAFFNCTNLTEVIVEEGVKVLDSDAFGMSYNLVKLQLPDGLIEIGDNIVRSTAYYDDPANWQNGAIYINNYMITADPNLSGDYSIPEGTVLVAEGIFRDNAGLTAVVFPESVRYIGEHVLSYCTSLQSITLPDHGLMLPEWFGINYDTHGNHESWENDAYYIGNHLIGISTYDESFTIKDGTVSIATEALEYSYADVVIMPASVQSIARNALYVPFDYVIQYQGTIAQWEAIEKHEAWDGGGTGRGSIMVEAIDGTVGVFGAAKNDG